MSVVKPWWTGLTLMLLMSSIGLAEETARPIVLLEVKGTIDPAVARYVTRGLAEARAAQSPAVIVQLDTAGGLDGSMRTIIQGILSSPVPVVVFVAPSGARAASAGAFIAMAAHVAAMAPGTNIGAAHPVQLGGGEPPSKKEGADAPSAMEEKLTNDAVAYITSLAELRGRNVEWAKQAVRESRSSSAEEAKERKVIDAIAHDLDDLVRQVEGKEVKTAYGTVVLALTGSPRRTVAMTLIERSLHQLAHPNLAYLLLLIGIYGLIYELATPGAVFPGVLGAISLVLGLVALETLEVNWAGIALILLSALFFIADIKLPGYGALTVGGIIAFVLGSAILLPGWRLPHFRLPWTTIGAAAAATAAFFLGVVGAGLRALRGRVVSGPEALVGATGVAKTMLDPEGIVHIRGEEWRGRATHRISAGAPVKVLKVDGLTVHVEEG